MELRHLRYLVAVADDGTFVRAAERLRVAQPALSRQVRDLEREIGVPLFEREARGVSLTAAGEACVAGARQVLAETDAAVERARLASRGLVGTCVISAGPIPLLTGLLGRLVEYVAARYPGLDLVVREWAVHEQWEALREATADIGIGGAPVAEFPELQAETQMRVTWGDALLPTTHPLAARASVRLAELADDTYFYWMSTSLPETTRLVRAEFARRGFIPARSRPVQSTETMGALIGAGQGWTIGPAILRDRLHPGMVGVPFEDFSVPHRVVRIRRRADERPVVQTVFEALRALEEGRAAPAPPASPLPDEAGASPRRPDLRHLRYFVAVAEQGSVGRAAESLGLTQPALSRQMRDLEREVGVPLLDREPRGVVPTLAGVALLRDARRILAEVERLSIMAQRARRALTGRCIIGAVPMPAARQLITRGLREVATEFSDAELLVAEVPSPLQAAALREGRIDIGVCNSPSAVDAPGLAVRRERLLEDAMDTALLAVDHPLASRRAIEARELADIPFLFMRRDFSPAFHDLVMGRLAAAGLRPRVDGEYEGLVTVWTLAAEGRGFCLGLHSQRRQAPPGLAAVPIIDFSVPWGTDALVLAGESRPLVLSILEALRRAAHAVSPVGGYPSPLGTIPATSPAR